MKVTLNTKEIVKEVVLKETVQVPSTVTIEVSLGLAALIHKHLACTNCNPITVAPVDGDPSISNNLKHDLGRELYSVWVKLDKIKELPNVKIEGTSVKNMYWHVDYNT